jgi:acetyl-CoA acyltransferase 1
MTGHSVRRDHSQEPFAALLLADRVLSQENNSAPSTPIVSRRADPHTPIRHSRGVQSLSSLPSTPRSSRPHNSNSTLLPSAPISEAQEKHTPSQRREYAHSRQYERRRKSRDSTISASDSEEIARATRAYREESEEVQASQASQSATEMLRLDPRESFEVAASRTGTPGGEKYQSKIMAPVSKRKREDDVYGDAAAKKMRMAEAVGLGIGYDNN